MMGSSSPHHVIIIIMIRYAFLELGVEDGVILARTDSLGAGLTQKIPVSKVCVIYVDFVDFLQIQHCDH